MACYHPLRAFRTTEGVSFSELSRNDNLGELSLPCGQCLGCRLRRAEDWTLRIMHEAQMWRENCFVTLTYDDEHLPARGHLQYSDFQRFMKRLRKRAGVPVRFFVCGEYGPLNLRPHYHACLFNVDFGDRIPRGRSASGAVYFDSPILRELWPLGHVSVQDLNSSTAGYCAKYIVDKVTGDDAEEFYGDRPPEFSRCSLKPGIGAAWFEQFSRDVYAFDHAILHGSERSAPRYYDKLEKRKRDVSWDEIEQARIDRARAGAADQTPERLAVREVVHRARVSKQKRSAL